MNLSLKTLLKAGLMLDLYFFKNNRAAFISMLLWPYLILTLILGMGMMFGSPESFKNKVGTNVDPIVYFVASTFVVMSSVDVMWGVGGQVLSHRWIGTLPYTLLAPYRTSIVLILSYVPRYLLSTTINILEFTPLILLVSGLYRGAIKLGVLFLAATVGMFPLLGFSALFASLLLTIKEESNILSWLNPIILLFSGAFYPAYLLPYWARLISQALPTTYTIELARTAALLSSPNLAHVTFLIGLLAGIAVVYNFIAYLMMGAGERKAMREGVI